jgi:hypothetical protein
VLGSFSGSEIVGRDGIYDELKVRYARSRILDACTAFDKEVFMAQQSKNNDSGINPMNPMERLVLRVSSMINHPIAQERREVRIHRLDTDGEREWSEILGALSEADGIDMLFHDDDESITLRWEPSEDDERPASAEEEPEVEAVPF